MNAVHAAAAIVLYISMEAAHSLTSVHRGIAFGAISGLFAVFYPIVHACARDLR